VGLYFALPRLPSYPIRAARMLVFTARGVFAGRRGVSQMRLRRTLHANILRFAGRPAVSQMRLRRTLHANILRFAGRRGVCQMRLRRTMHADILRFAGRRGSQMRLRRTLRAEGMWQYSVNRVQHLGPGDFAEEFEFDKCLNSSCRLLFTSCLLTKRHSIVAVSTTHNSYVSSDEKPHATVENNVHLRYTVCVCCAVLDDHVISHFVVEGHLEVCTFDFCWRNFPNFVRMCL
jgi:hypothetical protein